MNKIEPQPILPELFIDFFGGYYPFTGMRFRKDSSARGYNEKEISGKS